MRLQMSETSPAPEPTRGGMSLADELIKRLLDQRRVLLTGEVTDELAHSICAQLLVCASEAAPDEPVVLLINSPGGSVDAGFAIYDTM
jgi:ATP-dependent Clp protease protease subunit